MTPEMAAQGQHDAHRLTKVVSPWANGRSYLNFAESAVDPRTGYKERAWFSSREFAPRSTRTACSSGTTGFRGSSRTAGSPTEQPLRPS